MAKQRRRDDGNQGSENIGSSLRIWQPELGASASIWNIYIYGLVVLTHAASLLIVRAVDLPVHSFLDLHMLA